MTIQQIEEILDNARIHTMGGDCVTAAIALNEVLLDGAGEYIIATNLHLNEKYPDQFNFEEPFIGHMAVFYNNYVIDGRGTISQSDFEAFGDVSQDDKDFASSYPDNMGVDYEEAKDGDIVFLDDSIQVKNALKNTDPFSSLKEKKERLRDAKEEVMLKEIIRYEIKNLLD